MMFLEGSGRLLVKRSQFTRYLERRTPQLLGAHAGEYVIPRAWPSVSPRLQPLIFSAAMRRLITDTDVS
jgi:hypothetical protein